VPESGVTGDLSALTVVADGDGFVVGSLRSAEYVAVPDIGAQVIRWLQQGADVAECERRALALTGDEVDVEDFLADLAALGLFAETDEPAGASETRARIGRLLFHPVGWTIYAVVTLAGAVLLATDRALWPTYHDGLPYADQLLNILVISAFGMARVAVHEGGHVLAAAARGLRSSLSVTRRLYFLTFQADLTRLWSLPRRARYGPLLAGMTLDATVLGLALITEAALPQSGRLLRAVVLLQFTGLVTQLMIFMRTDVYALLVNATGTKTLWASKGALLRRNLGRATAADRRQLAEAGPRELKWARIYLLFYVPGIALALAYAAYYAVPGLIAVLKLCVAPIRAHGLTTLSAWAGIVALLLVVVPSVITLTGAVRSGVAVLRRLRR
jgi:hypothetical protein